jgi:hypothetical protein
MHEVGVHLGLERLLPKATYDKLIKQLYQWVRSDDGSQESQIAQAAAIRVVDAGTVPENKASELLAYFVEEAVESGIDPTAAVIRANSPLREWFRTLWAAFKVAVRRLGFKPESMTTQDIVNLAFGAARLEINGTWHGTAAAFRKFNHDFMGTGEGAQVRGWGSYLAQAVGIGKSYWAQDVKRKTPRAAREEKLHWGDGTPVSDDDLLSLSLGPTGGIFRELRALLASDWEAQAQQIAKRLRARIAAGESQRDKPVHYFEAVRDLPWVEKVLERGLMLKRTGGPEGSLMRVDTSVADEETLDLDTVLSKQPKVLRRIEAKIPEGLREEIEEEVNKGLAEMTGEDFYRALEFVERRDGSVSEQFDVTDYNTRLANSAPKRIVSAYLDEKLGIPALKFLDANSRGPSSADKPRGRTRNLVVFNDKNIFRVGAEVGGDPQRMKFGKAAASKLPPVLQKPANVITQALSDAGRVALNTAMFRNDLIKRAVGMGMGSAATFQEVEQQRAALSGKLEREVERVVTLYGALPGRERGTGANSANQFLYDSTREGKWGFLPDWRAKSKVTPDAGMQTRFNALSKESQTFIRAVFKHGDDVLAIKKKAVLDATSSEYDGRIAAAIKAKNLTLSASLQKAKAADIKRFQSLFDIHEFRPYTSMKRFGDFVVIARSAKFMQATEAERRRLESDPDHYHVDFAENRASARELEAQLKSQGAFAEVVRCTK